MNRTTPDGDRQPEMASPRFQPSPAAAVDAPASLLTAPGQRVEIDLFGNKITGKIIRSGAKSVAVEIPRLSDVRAMRIGTRVKALFAARGAAAEITCGLSRTQDHIVLDFLSTPRLIQRRRHQRFELQAAVDLAWRDRATNAWFTCRALTQDVSEGGARLVLTRSGHDAAAAPIPETIMIMALRGSGETAARTVHVDGDQIRMEFLQPSTAFLTNLLNADGQPRLPAAR